MPPSRTPPALAIRLLGPPQVTVRGTPLSVDTRKAVAVLAVIAADPRPYGRDELAALLWPESDDEAARGALRRTLSVLRGAVDDDALLVDRQRVALAEGRAFVDVRELIRLGASEDAGDLAAAAELVRGPFMAGFTLRDSPEFDDWRAAKAVAIERTVGRVLDRHAEALATRGDLVGAADVAGRRIDLDPLDEGAHVRRMELLAASGDRAGAVRQYRACVAVLERELGVEPLPQTTARYEAIRDAAEAPVQVAARATVAAAVEVNPSPATAAGDSTALPLVGRDEALRLADATRRSIIADGRVVVIVGEPGIGKSRLAAAIGERARDAGAVVVATSAYVAEREIAYGAIAGALQATTTDPGRATRVRALGPDVWADLRRIVPGLVAPPEPRSAQAPGPIQARLLASIADALTAGLSGPTPGVLVVDDLHWADGATIAAIAYLLRRLAGRPVLVVLTWRDEELPDEARPVAELARRLAGPAAIPLSRLSRPDVETLVAAVAPERQQSVDKLWQASEGLPLYLAAFLAEATAPNLTSKSMLPLGVRAVLSERLARVDGVAAQVLVAAAAIGRAFEVSAVRHASGRSEDEVLDALDALTARGLIREGGGQTYDFTHAALRDLAEESTSLARRRLLHRRIAESLRADATGSGRNDPARLARVARHERAAGRDAEAAAAYREAGDAASLVYANREAIEAYEAALGLGHPAASGLHTAVGDLLTRVGDYAGAIRAYESAAARAEASDLPAIEASLSRVHLRAGDLVAADRHLDEALAGSGAPAWQAMRLVDRAAIRRRTGDREGARQAAAAAATIAQATGEPAVIGAARRVAGFVALDAGDVETAIRELAAAREATDATSDPTGWV
ncbi:MAG TPA: AAA family ATPase, partial [Candidatus Limnocylindrales bacterium]|nr:AAA family ATPase [Candidatus Limnocylindrales bacterium]